MIKINKNNIRVVKFGASWCLPCKQLDKILKEFVEKEFLGNDSVKFEYYDIESDVEIASKFEINSLPTTFIISDSEDINILYSFVGIKPATQIKEIIYKNI